ncbi:MAG: aminotransferase class I/II-fold pyridoxal phosphate-dependent enzyme, partial [Phycisphaerae bacterium]|nr:aminotransferase class I/II-fold pyridoxal phosphate-dependent enzyme [Phycisphaerae bacterium]
LGKLGYTVTPSQANFLLVRPPAGDAERIYNRLKARGILVRYFKRAEIADRLRITIGTPAQNEALVGAMRQLIQ